MRALNGSIITAAALIGLGLCAVGHGLRYQRIGGTGACASTHLRWIQLDTPMMLIIVALLLIAIVGLATAFLGLAYHHERRHYERYGASSGSRSDALR